MKRIRTKEFGWEHRVDELGLNSRIILLILSQFLS
jgi:hypothetical protein